VHLIHYNKQEKLTQRWTRNSSAPSYASDL